MKDTMATDLAAYLDSLVDERGLAENTCLSYRQALRKFASFAEAGGVADYLAPQTAEISRFLGTLCDQGLSAASRATIITALRMFYLWLTEHERLTAGAARPVAKLTTPKLPQRLPRVLSVDQVLRLLDAPRRTAKLYWLHRSLLEFLYATGARASEATSLRMDNLDLDAAVARIVCKGSKERIVLLGEPAVQALHAYNHLLRPELIRRQPEPPWVFLSKTGQQLTREHLWHLVNGYAISVGLPAWVGVHSMRHAAATHCLLGGADVRFAQEILGHSNAETTARYLNLDTSNLRVAHDRLEAYREQGEPAPQPPVVMPKWLPVYRGRDRWLPAEDDIIRTKSIDEACVLLPQRTRQAIKDRRSWLGVKTRRCWTVEEDAAALSLPPREAARKTGRSIHAVNFRRKLLYAAESTPQASEGE